MGHLKLTLPDNVVSPRFSGRPKAEVEAASQPGAEDVALAKIAQRFAPGVQSFATPHAQSFGHKAPGASTLFESLPGLRALVAALIVVALLPSLTLAGMLWLGLIATPWSALVRLERNESAPQVVKTASLAGMPARNELNRTAEIPPVSLTAPTILEAKAGGDTPFAIGVISTATLPARSIIAISGLPRGSALSSGRPYGEWEWNLRSDEIGDLRLVLPNTARGETKLRIDLIAPDGESIAYAETLLKVTAEANAAGVVVGPREGERAAELEVSDLSGVRAFVAGAAQDGRAIDSEPPAAEDWPDQDREIVDSSSPAAQPKGSDAAEASDEPVQSAINPPAAAAADATSIELSEFVNLREGPSSSERVIGVMEKGSKLRPIARKRGWVKVTNVATSETGWIYARYAASATKSRRISQMTVPSRLGPEPDDSFWTRFGRWVSGP